MFLKRMQRYGLRFLRGLLGASLYRRIRESVFPDSQFDEVKIVFDAIGRKLRGRGFMIDVGGHHGESLARFSEENWRIHCFEPNPENLPILLEVAERANRPFFLDGSSGVVVFQAAVSNKVEKGKRFYLSRESSGISSLHPFHASHEFSFGVDVTTLDIHLESENIRDVDFLKVDTEGFDFFVLQGLNWERVLPKVIVCEFEDRKTLDLGYGFHDMARYLLERNYLVFISEWRPIEKYGSRHTWLCLKKYPCELSNSDGWGNIVAVQREGFLDDLIKSLNALSEN